MSRTAVSVVIPIWNGAEVLSRLLDSLARQTVAPDEVIAVDNGSTDAAPNIARSRGATVIALGVNRGFAAAVNRGIAESRGEWIAILNSDVELRIDWIERITCAAKSAGAWAAGGRILCAANPLRIDGGWDLIARSGCACRAGFGMPDGVRFDHERAIDLLPATAALYRRALFEKIGTFAEDYGSYLEDVDLSLRAAAARLPVIYVPQAVCTHVGSVALGAWSGEAVRLLSRNQLLLTKRIFPARLRAAWRGRIIAGQLLHAFVALRHRRLLAWVEGKREALRMWGCTATLQLNEEALRTAILRSEREIATSETRSTYWRLYFLVTRGASE